MDRNNEPEPVEFQSIFLLTIFEQISKTGMGSDAKKDAVRAAAIQSAIQLGFTVTDHEDDLDPVTFSFKRDQKTLNIDPSATPLAIAEQVFIAEAIKDAKNNIPKAMKSLANTYDQITAMYELAAKNKLINPQELEQARQRLKSTKENINQNNTTRLILQ